MAYLDLELLGHLVRVYLGILGSNADCQLDHTVGFSELTPGVWQILQTYPSGTGRSSTCQRDEGNGQLTRLGLLSDRLIKYFLIIFCHPLLAIRRELLSD